MFSQNTRIVKFKKDEPKQIRSRLGEILIDTEVISPRELETALEVQKKKKCRLGMALVGMEYIDIGTLFAALERQRYLRSEKRRI